MQNINKQIVYRYAALIVPILCLFVVVGVILYQVHRYQQLSSDLGASEKQMVQLEQLLKDMEKQPPATVTPALVQSPIEQPDFLNVMRTYADSSHVQLTHWANSSGGPVHNGSAADASKKPLPSGVTSITSSIELGGSFNDLRRFLYGLESASRLFTITDMVCTRNEKWPAITLKLNLTRYIAPIGSAPLQVPSPAAPPKATATVQTAATPAKPAGSIMKVASLPAGNALSPSQNPGTTTKGNP